MRTAINMPFLNQKIKEYKAKGQFTVVVVEPYMHMQDTNWTKRKSTEWTVTEKLEVKNGDQDTCTVHSSNKEHWGKVITVKCKMSFYETKNGQKKHLTDLTSAHKLLTPSLLIHQISFNHVQGKHDKDAMDLLKTYKGKIIDVPEATFATRFLYLLQPVTATTRSSATFLRIAVEPLALTLISSPTFAKMAFA